MPPHVVFEVRSSGNIDSEMGRKLGFYDRHGVQEYYFFDPDGRTLQGWIRRDGRLEAIDDVRGWTSPLLGIRFEPEGPEGLTIYHPDGTPFAPPLEAREDALAAREAALEARKAAREERRRRLAERRSAEATERLAQAECQKAEAERERAERYLAGLRELGELPD